MREELQKLPLAAAFIDMQTNPKLKPLRKAAYKIAIMIVVLFGSANLTEASSLRSRRIDGIVKSIDFEKHTLTIEPLARQKGGAFAWSKQTYFFRDLKRVPPIELYEGAQATIYYRSPFIGSPRLTRIIWRQPNL